MLAITTTYLQFQSTLPRGERRLQNYRKQMLTNFNPRSRVGSDTIHQTWQGYSSISIHTPCGGQPVYVKNTSVYTYFNPRSRAGSDKIINRSVQLVPISIHAPAWGATRICKPNGVRVHISIHAPVQGATIT